LLDDLEVGAAGEEPGGMCVARVVDAHLDHQFRLLQRRLPDAEAVQTRKPSEVFSMKVGVGFPGGDNTGDRGLARLGAFVGCR
jgi:hypothetical protein